MRSKCHAHSLLIGHFSRAIWSALSLSSAQVLGPVKERESRGIPEDSQSPLHSDRGTGGSKCPHTFVGKPARGNKKTHE